MDNLFSGMWVKKNEDNTYSYIQFREHEVKYKDCNSDKEYKNQFISVINDKEFKNVYLGFDCNDNERKEVHIEIVNPTTIKVYKINGVEIYTKVNDSKSICEGFKEGD